MSANVTGGLIVVGRNATIWKWLRGLLDVPFVELSHGEVSDGNIAPGDIVWILSYSRHAAHNRRLLQALADTPARGFIYVSTATANIAGDNDCYSYPRAKLEAEGMARELLNACIVRIGMVYREESELPAGRTAATSVEALAAAMQATVRGGVEAVQKELFSMVDRPFASQIEHLAYRTYGLLMAAAPSPCLLRPLDALLRFIGWRWYGYLYLSNRRWSATPS